jgi:beta-glucosidase
MLRAQNDLYMVVTDAEANSGNDDTLQGLAEGRLTRGELLRAACNICRFLLDTPAFARMYRKENADQQ